MASTSTTVTSVDCEGACCCRCMGCGGVGYWNAYKLTIPVCNNVIAAGPVDLNNPHTYTIPLTPPLFGSAGGTGVCGASFNTSFIQSNGMLLAISININIFADGHATLYIQFSMGGGGNSYVLDVYWNCESFDCRLGGSFVFDHDTFTQVGWTFAKADYSGTTINVIPDGAATWQQCGQNSDGTTYEESPPPLLISSTMTAASKPTVKKSLDVIPRPDRCDSYNGRDKLRPGCNGWLCSGKCAKGIKQCMPGGFCQACEKYVVDPDFIGQGPAGWAK